MNDSVPALGKFIDPAPVHFSFGAPGWYVVAGIIFLFMIIFTFMQWTRYRRNYYRREAIKFLEKQKQQLFPDKSYQLLVYNAEMLMKRIGMERYGRERIASLHGQEWLNFLNYVVASDLFKPEDGKLVASLYEPNEKCEENQVRSFIDKTKHWIKKHKYVVKSF